MSLPVVTEMVTEGLGCRERWRLRHAETASAVVPTRDDDPYPASQSRHLTPTVDSSGANDNPSRRFGRKAVVRPWLPRLGGRAADSGVAEGDEHRELAL